ncbi:MAG TPA: hypothetical protein VHA06_06040 [Candidatus Angelobacter sp.]|nr:hypothetical protein [Candidatus Angelobacter sp.]
MSISSVGGSDLSAAVSQVAANTTTSDASISVLKKTIDASASTASGLASLISDVTGTGSKISTYA